MHYGKCFCLAAGADSPDKHSTVTCSLSITIKRYWSYWCLQLLFVLKSSESHCAVYLIENNWLLLLCGWPFISLSLFHSFLSVFPFFFVYSFPWLTEGIFGKQNHLSLYFNLTFSYTPPLPEQPPSLHPFFPLFCCCAVSSLGWWSNQCSNQTWA